MKRIESGAAVFGMLVMFAAAAHAQVFAGDALYKAERGAAAKADGRPQRAPDSVQSEGSPRQL